MHIVKNRTTYAKIFVPAQTFSAVIFAAEKFARVVKKITGAEIAIEKKYALIGNECGLVFCTDKELSSFYPSVKNLQLNLSDDGFAVKKIGQTLLVVAKSARGVVFGSHDLLEKNADVVFSRGSRGEDVDVIPSIDFEISVYDYCEDSPFSVRAWNICGIGSEGNQHADDGTAEFIAANKSNSVSHHIESSWYKYGLFGAGLHFGEINNFDDLIHNHPEYFMTGQDGKPMPALGGHDSFLNYYNKDVAKVFAERLVELQEKTDGQDSIFWVMPDNPYFCMEQDGVKLHELPFTADDGTTVYPTDEDYKSTVYFNFLNRAIKFANSIRSNTRVCVFAYTYSETVPRIAIDERIDVYLAPISTNDKYSYVDEKNNDNLKIKENLEKWAKKTKSLGIYTYWNSFKGTIYSRPILSVVKENLLWFKGLGIKKIIVEGKVDCTLLDGMTEAQKNSVKFYDMNQAYVWAVHKLLWNPDLQLSGLIEKYCKIVYKECAPQMLEYFSLIEKGWANTDAMVWYTTGGDIYYLQMVIGAGVSGGVMNALENANKTAQTESVKRKVGSVYQTVKEQIEKYKDFVKEQAEVLYCKNEDLLSTEQMNYVFNADSVWNKAKPLVVLRDYGTLEYYPKEAKFSCRMIYDDENIYIGYTIFDDKIEKEVVSSDGKMTVLRSDGSELISYTETYIGGNVFNQSIYYGYISGFMGDKNANGQFYRNAGVPKSQPIPDGVKDVKYVHFDDDPDKRYYFHVQVLPFKALDANKETFNPYGSFVYYTDRYGRAGWMGYGLWSKQNFSPFTLIKGQKKAKENNDGKDQD